MKRIDEKYEVVKELGAGGMGSVYEARHERTGRRVAIKVIKEDVRLEPGVVERFQREARAAGSIESENITEVLDGGVDRESGAPYLVMELMNGEDVEHALKRLGPLPPELATRIVAQMLLGLERAHEADVIHRDIKPANVFLARKGGGDRIVVKVGDFGVAKVKPNALADGDNHALTQSSSLLGSPSYMSPEQAKGSKAIDGRSDLWSTGTVLYQLLAGQTPHAGNDTLGLLLLAICTEPATPVRRRAPWVSAKLEAVVMRALEMNADARFQSARQMREALVDTLPDPRIDLDASMFVPLTAEQRTPSDPAAHMATVLEKKTPPVTPVTPVTPVFEKTLENSVASVSASVARVPLHRPRWHYAAGVVAVLGAIGAVGARLGGSDRSSAAASSVRQTVAAPPSAPPSMLAPVVPPPPPSVPSASPSASASASPSPSASLSASLSASPPPVVSANVVVAAPKRSLRPTGSAPASAVSTPSAAPPASATAAAPSGNVLREFH